MTVCIEALLKTRNSRLDEACTPFEAARARAGATRFIGANFSDFEVVRNTILNRANVDRLDPLRQGVVRRLVYEGICVRDGGVLHPAKPEMSRYLRGGWLEEYAGLAATAAGADEVRIGQVIRWTTKGASGAEYEGCNEIDTLARFGNRLVFVSAKALRSRLEAGDASHRAQLMGALQEADNLADHFGDGRSVVLLLVTTDLFDELRNRPRYMQLYGKAAALGVGLIGLELLTWDSLVAALAGLATVNAGHNVLI